MCNLYSNFTTAEEMRRLFRVEPQNSLLGNAPALPAIWPKTMAPVVRRADERDKRELLNMSWGFLTPKFSKRDGRPIKPAAWNNARDDKVDRIPLWRSSFQKRRCLVPATSFCEMKGRGPTSYVWFAMATGRVVGERPPFAFAGIWRVTPDGVGHEVGNLLTYSVITTVAKDLVATVLPGRIPVILDPTDYDTWLEGDPEEARALLRPFPAGRMCIAREGIHAREDVQDESLQLG